MNKIIASIFIFLLLILQVAFMPHLAFFGVFPDILLAAMMILAVLRGGKWVFILSLLSGLALDVFSNHPFGIYALDFILLTWLTEYVGKNIFRATDISGQVSLLALACVVFTSLNYHS
jgi:rod shape-determining protein MreD